MRPEQRILTHLPLTELWTERGPLTATRTEFVDSEAIRELLRRGPVQFVIANVGLELHWVPLTERFSFWNEEVAPHIAEKERIDRDAFEHLISIHGEAWLESLRRCACGGSPSP